MNRAPTWVRPAANGYRLGQHVVLSLPRVSSGERFGVGAKEADLHAAGLEEVAGLLAEDQDDDVVEARDKHAHHPEEGRASLQGRSELVDLDAPEDEETEEHGVKTEEDEDHAQGLAGIVSDASREGAAQGHETEEGDDRSQQAKVHRAVIRGDRTNTFGRNRRVLTGKNGASTQQDTDGLPLGHTRSPGEVRSQDLSGRHRGLEGLEVVGSDRLAGSIDLVVHVGCGVGSGRLIGIEGVGEECDAQDDASYQSIQIGEESGDA